MGLVTDLPLNAPVLFGAASLVILYLVVRKFVVNRQQLPLPPGPKGIPILGNIADLPPPGPPEWTHWLKHKDLYGPISSITVLGQPIILIHDLDIAEELLVKRSSNFSSRPYMFFAAEMCGFGHVITFQNYNKNFKQQRKLAAWQIGSTAAIQRFQSLIDSQIRRFLIRTWKNPDSYVENLHSKSSSIMLDMLYGYKPSRVSPDPLIGLVDKIMAGFSETTAAGVWLVDMIPWLRHLPEFLPGMRFKAIARYYQRVNAATTNAPVDFAMLQKKKNQNRPCYVSGLLDRQERKVLNDQDRDEESALIKASALSLYGGGSDTTVAALSFFFRMMIMRPDIQTKAREELDRVVGRDRLPGFGDRANLPFVEALFLETLRHDPIVPSGFPHTADADDEFSGYRIPKGAIILPSIQWISRDPNIYSEPDLFRPERFLGDAPELSPKKFVFGFGRRVCPGQKLADSVTFLTIAQTLAVFEMKKPVDPITRKAIEPKLGSSPGTVSHPSAFKCSFVPRDDKSRALLARVESKDATDSESDLKVMSEILMNYEPAGEHPGK